MLDPAKFARLDLDSQDRILDGFHRMAESERQSRNARMARVIIVALSLLGAGMLACVVALVS